MPLAWCPLALKFGLPLYTPRLSTPNFIFVKGVVVLSVSPRQKKPLRCGRSRCHARPCTLCSRAVHPLPDLFCPP